MKLRLNNGNINYYKTQGKAKNYKLMQINKI